MERRAGYSAASWASGWCVRRMMLGRSRIDAFRNSRAMRRCRLMGGKVAFDETTQEATTSPTPIDWYPRLVGRSSFLLYSKDSFVFSLPFLSFFFLFSYLYFSLSLSLSLSFPSSIFPLLLLILLLFLLPSLLLLMRRGHTGVEENSNRLTQKRNEQHGTGPCLSLINRRRWRRRHHSPQPGCAMFQELADGNVKNLLETPCFFPQRFKDLSLPHQSALPPPPPVSSNIKRILHREREGENPPLL